ncbi:Holliday junction branch migration protein RuvA [Mycoplasma parvum]|uniref:Holliday junction branch migration complex subunit RuvA n=1 Tax=Mycoplasma parvum str. Indiana TaxID=1403316 RepID=U5NBX4_9MOLU|nr:Holliday junction branch migration protein RuvA [Mycoplasma parvum]AGX88892.1 hypothetical protein PRV_00620 [Mycoplasma parvum str. Indiana]
MHYLKAQIISIHKNYVIAENNNIGYKIYLAEANSLKEGDNYLIYLFKEFKLDNKNQIISHLYGFLTEKEYELFNNLMTIKGIGCKTAQTILTNDWNMICILAEQEERLKLAELRGFNLKTANLFIYALKNTKFLKNSFIRNFESLCIKENNSSYMEDEIISSLIKIGYTFEDIKRALVIIKENNSQLNDFNSIINECLKAISQFKYH